MATMFLTGARITLWINNKQYKTVQSVNFSVDYGETEIYGIDSEYAQEIAGTKVTVRGSVQGLRIESDGGLQGQNMRPLYSDLMASPYISIRIQDRRSTEDIIFIPNAKVTKETHTIGMKSVYHLNFDFVGQIPQFALDRA